MSKIGDRGKGSSRLWVEESCSYGRLVGNGFEPHQPISVKRRQGPGVIIEKTTESKNTISKRHAQSLLSIEGNWVKGMIPFLEAKIKITYGRIFVIPTLISIIIHREKDGVAHAQQETISSPSGIFTWDKRTITVPPRELKGYLNYFNIILISEFIQTFMPGEIELQGDIQLLATLGQYLNTIGYNVNITEQLNAYY